MPIIDADQAERFKRDGYILLKDFVDRADCDALRLRAEELVAEFDPNGVFSIFTTREQARKSDEYFLESGDKVRFFFEEDAFDSNGRLIRSKESSINKIGHALHDLDPIFNRFSRNPKTAQLVCDLGIDQPLLVQSMYVFKQPMIGGEVDCHQDASFLYADPPTLLGLWFALEDATIENGCLWAIPEGHKRGLKSRFIRAESGGTRFEVYDGSPWPIEKLIPLEAPKGSLIALDGLLPHMSRANRSERSRHAYTLHIIDSESRFPSDNWLRRNPEMPLRGFY